MFVLLIQAYIPWNCSYLNVTVSFVAINVILTNLGLKGFLKVLLYGSMLHIRQ